MPFFAASEAPPRPESMKFPVNSLLAGNLAFSETSSQLTPPSCGESVANFRRVLSRFVLEFGTGLYGCRPPLNLATQPAGRTTQNQSTPITKPTPEITTVEISQERHAG